MRVIHHQIPHHHHMSAFPHQCHWKILDSSNGHRLLAGWAPSIQKYKKKKILLNDPRIGRTFRYWRCWDIDHPGICTPFIASIQISIVAACLEQWQTRKPSHVECRCNRIDFNSIGNMDKADDFPTLGTIIPFRGQYSGRITTLLSLVHTLSFVIQVTQA